MGRINILSSDIYNKIAAGEVVANPQAVVKELVENSIDAGASRVRISIMGGGVDSIEVSDNGCGMAEDDLELAFLQHATSKLDSAEQLFEIETLGFRGEALASIAAVADVCIVSKTPTSDTACRVYIKNGKVVLKEYTSYNVGTKITVTDLFSNVPARRKFLKSDQREVTLITQYITRLILTNPTLEVDYAVNGKTIYSTQGNGLEESLTVVYGNECLQNCLPIRSTYKDITVTGYIGTPEYCKPNATYQTVSVNGRYVRDPIIVSAVKQAFIPFLMKRSFPFYCLNVEIDKREVDVNVHPSKMEVRFADSRKVFVAVAYPVKEALKRFAENKVQRVLENNHNTGEQISILHLEPVDTRTNEVYVPLDEKVLSKSNMYTDEFQFTPLDAAQVSKNTMSCEEYVKIIDALTWQAMKDEQAGSASTSAVSSRKPNYKGIMPVGEEPDEELAFYYDFSKVRTHGIAFNTYLILQIDDKLIFVDQHAAHERLLYDKYIASANNMVIQPLALPYVFTLSVEEAQFMQDNLEAFAKSGFEIEPFGNNTFRITGVAGIFAHCSLERFVRKLLSDIDFKHIDNSSVLTDAIAKQACRHATKAGDILTDEEVMYIVKCIFANKQLQCPHGRPITIEMTKSQLEKLFKRVL